MSSTAKSIPTAHSTPAQAPLANFEVQAKTSEPTELSNGKESAAGPVPSSRMTFPVILTVVAILPLAFGLGSIRLKASASAVTAPHVDESENESVEAAPEINFNDRRVGDREFVEHRYEIALRNYRSLGSPNSERLPAELQYRIALCQEALGLWDEALLNLRSVSESAASPELRAAACFGQARIWFRLNSPDQAETLLRSLEIHSKGACRLPKVMSQDSAFLIPLAMAQQVVVKAGDNSTFPLSHLLIWSLESALTWADETGPKDAADLNRDKIDPGVPADGVQCQLRRPTTDASSSFLIDESRIDLSCNGQTVQEVVQQVAKQCGWVVDWSDLKDDQSLQQPLNIFIENRPVWSLMTVISSELNASWSFDGDQLTFMHADPDGIRKRQMITRTLGCLATWVPNHRFVNHAQYARGQISQSQGDIAQAASIFAGLVGRDASTLAVRAAYDAAYNYYRMGDFARTCAQLRYVVDGAADQNLHAEALILLGRLLLDRGESQDAIYQLRRATESRCLPDQQARAAVLLGLSYLVQERYQEAAESLFSHKAILQDPGVRIAAAFVTAFARWHVVAEEMKERESVFLYRAIISLRDNSEWLGQTGQLLIGRAYIELGFDDMMADLYSHTMTIGVTEYIEGEMTYSLAGYELAKDRPETAKQLWGRLADGPSNRWKERSRLKLAEVALAEGRSRDAIELCEQTHAGDGLTRGEILKLMGRAYEQMGEDVLAAKCYAGQQPSK